MVKESDDHDDAEDFEDFEFDETSDQSSPNPSPDISGYCGFWDAITRTISRSEKGTFQPLDADWETIRRCVCQPMALKFLQTNPGEDLEQLINLQVARSEPGASPPLRSVLEGILKAVQIECSPAPTRDRDAVRYAKTGCWRILLKAHLKGDIRENMNRRVREAIADPRFLVVGQKLDTLTIDLAANPRRPLFPADDLEELVKRFGPRPSQGGGKHFGVPLPTASQISELAIEAMRETGKSFDGLDLVDLCFGVFEVPRNVTDSSLDRQKPGYSQDGYDTYTGKKVEEDPEEKSGYAEEKRLNELEILRVKASILDLITEQDRGIAECPKQGSYYRLFFELWCWKYDKGLNVVASEYQKISGLSDSTVDSRRKGFYEELKSRLFRFDDEAAIRALEELKWEKQEIFRKAWGTRPYPETDPS